MINRKSEKSKLIEEIIDLEDKLGKGGYGFFLESCTIDELLVRKQVLEKEWNGVVKRKERNNGQ